MPTTHSPSPPPRPPVASTPGPRATALTKLYADAIAHILKICSYPNFSSCFPTAAANVPTALRAFHAQFVQKLGASLHAHFEELVEERGVVASLNQLDRLIEEGRRRRDHANAAAQGEGEGGLGAVAVVPPHTLSAKVLFLSRLAPKLGEWERGMSERTEGLGRENEALLERVVAQRKDIAALVKGLEDVVGDLRGSVQVFGMEGDGEGLREEMRHAEEVMRED